MLNTVGYTSSFGSLTASARSNYATDPFALLNSKDIFGDFLKSRMNGGMMMPSPSADLSQLEYKHYDVNTNLPSIQNVYNPTISEKLARTAERTGLIEGTRGYCARGVNDTLQIAGLSNGEIRSQAAFQCADKLANSENFKEVYVKREELASLPAGCIICWNRTNGGYSASNIYGHIAVTLGNGKEASDHVSNLKTFNQEYRVFVPVQTNGVNA